MDITVILCTYNRCEFLAKALNSVGIQEVPDSLSWEVLVVDNNSSDRTKEVVGQFCRQHPGRFRYLFERQPGKSYALNAGIRASLGSVLAFMDDDVTVSPKWLASLTSSLCDGSHPGAGGRIVPIWDCPPPKWLPSLQGLALGPLVSFDLGQEPGPLRATPSGTNMAFRREMFDKYGNFRTDLGPRPGSEIRGEDSEFSCRLLSAGESLRYEPSAIVYHPVPANRLRKRYFLDWWFDKARVDVRTQGIIPATKWQVAGVPLVLFRRTIRWAACWWFSVEPSKRFSYKINMWMNLGSIVEYFHQSPEGKPAVRKNGI